MTCMCVCLYINLIPAYEGNIFASIWNILNGFFLQPKNWIAFHPVDDYHRFECPTLVLNNGGCYPLVAELNNTKHHCKNRYLTWQVSCLKVLSLLFSWQSSVTPVSLTYAVFFFYSLKWVLTFFFNRQIVIYLDIIVTISNPALRDKITHNHTF